MIKTAPLRHGWISKRNLRKTICLHMLFEKLHHKFLIYCFSFPVSECFVTNEQPQADVVSSIIIFLYQVYCESSRTSWSFVLSTLLFIKVSWLELTLVRISSRFELKRNILVNIFMLCKFRIKVKHFWFCVYSKRNYVTFCAKYEQGKIKTAKVTNTKTFQKLRSFVNL